MLLAHRHIMESEQCSICLNLNNTAIGRLRLYQCQLNYYTLRESATRCLYCKIILDGIEASGFENRRKVFMYSVMGTFRLTHNDSLASSSVGSTLEFSMAAANTSKAKERNTPSEIRGMSAPNAIEWRPTVTPFWKAPLREQLRRWLGEPQNAGYMPTRVLDLGEDAADLSGQLRLFEPRDLSAAYVTLSHCWVNRNILTTTSGNLATHLSSLLFSLLPPTFQEAVQVCRWLGVRYLWIDSLCIVQDDVLDWEEQASKMADIYENAFFTLAAHGTARSQHSLLPSPVEYEITTHLPTVGGNIRVRLINTHDFLSPADVILGGVGEQPPDTINGRGWCYQERLLSSQILHFTHSEVLHEDRNGRIRCQCGYHSLFNSICQRPSLKNSRTPTKLWRKTVGQYTKRSFTNQWDILPGLAGIARRFQQFYQPGQYLAGLWRGDLARWLCWKSTRIPLWGALDSGCERCGVWRRRLSEPPQCGDYVVPSFSWASRVGACELLENMCFL